MAFRRRLGATVVLRLNTNPKLLQDTPLSQALLKEIHVLPPPQADGTPRAEIILQNASIVDDWKLQATLPAAQHVHEGEWMADAYGTFDGSVVKIGRTVAWTTDAKYKSP
jgi:hypothetical protein